MGPANQNRAATTKEQQPKARTREITFNEKKNHELK